MRKVSGLSIELRRIGLKRAGRPLLRAIDWRIAPGQRWVLLGANGAGKTQLLKLLAGDVWPAPNRQSSRLYSWRGDTVDEPYGVKDEISYVGAERQDRYEHYEWNLRVLQLVGTGIHRTDIPLYPLTQADKTRALALLRALRIADLASRRFLTLSYGQRRLVLLARALAARPALLLLDEAFNGLDEERRTQLLDKFVTGRGMPRSWVLATHRVEDIPPQATHLLQLDRGRVQWQGRLTAARRRRLVAASASAPGDAGHRAYRNRAQGSVARRRRRSDASPWVRLHNGWVWLDGKSVLRRLSFTLASGECWVVHGPNGSGKSTLVRALYGDLGIAAQGTIRRRGIEPGVPISEFKRRVGLVAPELQTTHPLYLKVLDVVVSGLHSAVGLDNLPTAAESRLARSVLRRLGILALAGRSLRELSYGQMRRVLFARALVHQPDILLLDEPYTGLDARTRQTLLALVERLAKTGTTILITTHHRDEWPRATSHELELLRGAAAYCGVVRLA